MGHRDEKRRYPSSTPYCQCCHLDFCNLIWQCLPVHRLQIPIQYRSEQAGASVPSQVQQERCASLLRRHYGLHLFAYVHECKCWRQQGIHVVPELDHDCLALHMVLNLLHLHLFPQGLSCPECRPQHDGLQEQVAALPRLGGFYLLCAHHPLQRFQGLH